MSSVTNSSFSVSLGIWGNIGEDFEVKRESILEAVPPILCDLTDGVIDFLRSIVDREASEGDWKGSIASLTGDGNTLMLTGADSPWNQFEILNGLGLRSGLTSLVFVGFRFGMNVDHLSFSCEGVKAGEPGGDRSNWILPGLANRDVEAAAGGNAGFDSTWICVVINGGRCEGDEEVRVLA